MSEVGNGAEEDERRGGRERGRENRGLVASLVVEDSMTVMVVGLGGIDVARPCMGDEK